jgi:hypothetical protein
MAKDSDKLRQGVEVEDTGGALSGLLAEENEFDRRILWRLGTWAAVSVGAVVVALVTNQSSIGLRREQTASADLMRQAQQIQLTARESQSETRRLASAVETLNSDRDRLYSRVAVLEQGLDSVTGAIARQVPTAPPSQASAGPTSTGQASASAAPPASPTVSSPVSSPSPAPVPTVSMAPAVTASATPAVTASVDPPPTAAKPAPAAPVVAPVAATAPAVVDKQDKVADKQDKLADKKDKQASAAPPSDPSPVVKSAAAQQPPSPAQLSGSLMTPKSMMGPPDPAAGKLIEPVAPPKIVTAAPMAEIAAVTPKAPKEAEPDSAPAVPELVARRTEFGVDVGGANSVPGLRALWRGLLKSKGNAALTTLRPIIVIKESNSGLGMQLRLVAGPINDAAAAAKICVSLTANDRGCTATVFEGQRLTMGADEQAKADTKTASEAKPESAAKPESDSRPTSAPKVSFHRHYGAQHTPPKEEDPPKEPKEEPSTLSLIFGKH